MRLGPSDELRPVGRNASHGILAWVSSVPYSLTDVPTKMPVRVPASERAL